MPRLSDRAFQIVKDELDRCYGDKPDEQLERVIMLSRLENLRMSDGKPVSRIELWEEFSDVSPAFDPNVLAQALAADANDSLLGTPIGVGAVAVLVAAAVGVDAISASAPVVPLTSDSTNLPAANSTASNFLPVSATESATPSPTASAPSFTRRFTRRLFDRFKDTVPAYGSDLAKRWVIPGDGEAQPEEAVIGKAQPDALRSPAVITAPVKDAFETARAFGWRASLKAQNPPYSAQHWAETAVLWEQAIKLLDQVPRGDENYAAAQAKKAVYERNLAHIQDQQQAANAIASDTQPAPKFSAAKPSASQESAPQENDLAIAKRYGWQAALASQNAPHPAEKWADISRLWQLALKQIQTIDPDHPDYEAAQQVKITYQQNLLAIRKRYQQEQNANQRLQSLKATIAEIENSITLSNSSKRDQLLAIIGRLRTIPANTVAYQQAQLVIDETTSKISALPGKSPAQVAISPEEPRQ
ncbi:MAG: hypothetical protein AAFO83_03520 [Cyanobacteria bacterium J06607_13]